MFFPHFLNISEPQCDPCDDILDFLFGESLIFDSAIGEILLERCCSFEDEIDAGIVVAGCEVVGFPEAVEGKEVRRWFAGA
jgi:hypothetical protein